MDVRQCRRCRKLFQSTGNPLCPSCVAEVDKQFTDVRNYIYANPTAKMDDICEATGVEMDDIRRWIKEGRLIMHSTGVPLVECEKCGKPIHSGKLCAECRGEIHTQLSEVAGNIRSSASQQPQQRKDEANKTGSRMYTMDKKK